MSAFDYVLWWTKETEYYRNYPIEFPMVLHSRNFVPRIKMTFVNKIINQNLQIFKISISKSVGFIIASSTYRNPFSFHNPINNININRRIIPFCSFVPTSIIVLLVSMILSILIISRINSFTVGSIQRNDIVVN